MIDLNNLNEVKKYDPKNVLESTGLFIPQCQQIYQIVQNFIFPQTFSLVQNIVFCGMGGSALGAQVVYHLFKDQLKVPLYINNDYNLPGFVNNNTLVILSSYSGNTEEVLSSLGEARNKGTQILGFTTGGKLADILQEEDCPVLTFEPSNNPSGQPRLGTGYGVVGAMEILRKIKFLDYNQEELLKTFQFLTSKSSLIEQTAKVKARELYDSIPIIIAASHLSGCAHVLRNQLNETAKNFASYALLPELNHHLLEGLKNPANKKVGALILESDLYPEAIKKRAVLTKEIIERHNFRALTFQAEGKDKTEEALETLLFGGFLSFYLAVLYQQDPSVIPWVDYFKQRLAQ